MGLSVLLLRLFLRLCEFMMMFLRCGSVEIWCMVLSRDVVVIFGMSGRRLKLYSCLSGFFVRLGDVE